jgi:hypothetical protein
MVGLIRHNQREDLQKSLRANKLAATETIAGSQPLRENEEQYGTPQ